MSQFAVLTELWASPRQSFSVIADSPRFSLPLAVLIASQMLIPAIYFSWVDFDWYLHQLALLEPISADYSELTMAQVALPQMLAAALSFPIVLCMFATFYWLAGLVLASKHSWVHWFAFAVWTSTPLFLDLLAAISRMVFATNSRGLMLHDLSALSLNSLFVHLQPEDPYFALASSISLPVVLSAILATLGFAVWTRRGLWLSAIVVNTPNALLWGALAFFAASA